MFFIQPRGSSKFGPEAPIFSDRAPGAFILHLPKNLLILCAIDQVVLVEFRGVIEVGARSHPLFSVSISRRSESVFVYSSSQRPPYCGFIMFYYKAYLRCSDRCNTVLSTYLSLLSVSLLLGTWLAASWSSNMFAGAYQFNVHQLAEVFHGLSKEADLHELKQVFLKVPNGFLPKLSGARFRGSAQTRGPVDFL